MNIYCTRPRCSNPQNFFPELTQRSELDTVQQKFCTRCGMPLILAGRYLPQKLLGQGGFGAAFLAIDRYTPTHRKCVVKQFQPPNNLNPQQLELARNLFTREAEVLEQLGTKHPQIPDLYAFFPMIVGDEQFFYLVQEFIDGQNLETELQKKGKFSPPEIIDFLKEMLNILKFVHENNSIHRDIKPSNIMRDQEGKLYLLDFGAVKVTTQALDPKKASTQMYTPGYAPIEQMMGSRVYPCTDLYALGITCLVLLTGKSAPELYNKNNQINWRQYLQLSEPLGKIFDKMLQHNPEDRFQSAQEILDQLNPPLVSTPSSGSVIPQPQPSVPPVVQQSSPPPKPFPVMQMLSAAGFVGFQGTLILIAIANFFPLTISLTATGVVTLSLILGAFFRIFEKWEFVLISLISLGVVWAIPALHQILITQGFAKLFILLFPVLAAAVAVAATALFRLIYQLLSLIFK